MGVEGLQPWEVAQSHGRHREEPPPAPGLICGAELGSRVVGKGRPQRWAWANSIAHHVVGSEVQSGQPHCGKPVEVLWAVHGKGQETEE